MTTNLKSNAIANRARGCLYGLAIGDALGAAVEFKAPGTFAPVTGYRGGGPHPIEPGDWTDDTSMALALANSLGHGFNLDDQARRYWNWYQHGEYSVNGRCFDIGITTRNALHLFSRTGVINPDRIDDERTSGNGSIMRLAPVPIRYSSLLHTSPVELARYGELSSVTTHGSRMCRDSCSYLTLVLAGLIEGLPREDVLAANWDLLKCLTSLDPRVASVIGGGYRSAKVRGSGFVIDCLNAALWAFDGADTFESAVLRAVNLGDDADTTGAVCGELAGAYWGFDGIPAHLIDGLHGQDLIEDALSAIL